MVRPGGVYFQYVWKASFCRVVVFGFGVGRAFQTSEFGLHGLVGLGADLSGTLPQPKLTATVSKTRSRSTTAMLLKPRSDGVCYCV